VPQFWRLLVRLVSQPLPESPSQSPRPALQLEMPQTPPTQFAVPPVEGHTLPQFVQLLTSVLTFVSQPLFGLPSQLLKPDAHVGTHTPAEHVVLPFEFPHVAPHAPQFAVLLRGVSQPFLALPSQLPKPALHTGTQVPAAQDVVPFGLVHARPQPLQCATVVCVSVSQPLLGRLSQLPHPAEQAGAQVPLGQVVVPCAFVQAVPQTPQFAVEFRDASQPFEASVSQLPKPAVQAIPQVPEAQLGDPLLLLQTVPQVPQFDVLV
jgi:hypothetical protein